MSEWPELSVHLQGSVLFLLFLPPLWFFTYWVYRRTYPEAGPRLCLLLVFLRAAAFALLLAVLAEPVLGLRGREVLRPALLVLIDTSPSMATTEAGGARLQQVRDVLEQAEWRRALTDAEKSVWGFAEAPYPLSVDTLAVAQVRGQATNIAGALQGSLERYGEPGRLRGALLISDGTHNLGPDPVALASERGLPLYALGVGSGENPADIQIVRARAVETGYVGRALEIEAELRSWGYEGREVEVLLYEGEQVVARQRLALQGNALIQHLRFAVEPRVAGPHIYRLFVAFQEGEFSRENNEALVFARILEERIQVLLLAGGPGPDLAFLRRSLEADSNIVVEVGVQREEGRFYGGGEPDMEGRDVYALVNPGPALLGGPAAERLRDRVQAGAGLLLVGGPKTFGSWMPDGPLAELLPVAMGGRFVSRPTALRLSPAGRHHPVVRLQAAGGEGDPWAVLPPLPGYIPSESRRPGAVVLVEGPEGERVPLVVAGSHGQGKVVAALSGSFWRLDLMSSGVGGRPQTIREFWRNAVKWLALRAPEGRVRASTERHVYRAGEEIAFAAQVFDELLRPQSAASVQVVVDGEQVFQLQEQGSGQYRGTWSGLEPGEHHYQVRAHLGEALIGGDEGRFLVEQHSVESVDVRANQALLAEMARVSGGRFFPLEEWRQLLEVLPLQKKVVEEAGTFPLWGPLWPLLLAVALLALEWFLRKRQGMI